MGLRDTLEPLIGNPNQEQTLHNGEAFALSIHDHLELMIPRWQKGTSASFSTLLTKAKRWFATAKDRTAFRQPTVRLERVFDLLLDKAYPDVSMAYLDLSQDPPDLTGTDFLLVNAQVQRNTASEDVVGCLRALMKLL